MGVQTCVGADLTICDRMNKANQPYRFSIAPMMEWTDRAEKQSVIST
jgi:hypothetical protein